jgi:hypothetical protein
VVLGQQAGQVSHPYQVMTVEKSQKIPETIGNDLQIIL